MHFRGDWCVVCGVALGKVKAYGLANVEPPPGLSGAFHNSEVMLGVRPSGAFASTVLDLAKCDAALYTNKGLSRGEEGKGRDVENPQSSSTTL